MVYPQLSDEELKELLLEHRASAALGGHELGEFADVKTGVQAECRLCGRTIWQGYDGGFYSVLNDTCPRKWPNDPSLL